jgi:tetratricopeptide (TPR) repeat protein
LADFEGALKYYRRASELNPNDGAPYTNAGLVYAQDLRQLRPAYDAFIQAILRDPTNPENYYSMANVQADLQEYAQSEASLNTAVSLDPRNANAMTNLGALMFKQHRFTEAATHLERAVGFAPDDLEICYNYTLALVRCGRNAEAREFLKKNLRTMNFWISKTGSLP